MRAIEVVLKIREEANKNNTNDNIGFDTPRIVEAFNLAQNKFLSWISTNRKNAEDIRLIQKFLESDKPLKKSERVDDISEYFDLPDDFFGFDNFRCNGQKDGCVLPLNVWEIKTQNINENYNDENNKPSFEYAETFYHLGKDDVRVFVSDFTIRKAYLSYYRYPRKIDVEGYIREDGSNSIDIDPEWGDREMDRIISLAVKELNLNAENFNRAQIDMERVVSEK